MRRLIVMAALAAVLGTVRPAPGADFESEFEALLDDKDEVFKTDMEAAESGDLKEFMAVTDDNIVALEVGDIYKSNSTFFKVTQIRSKGTEGGKFVVQRVAGKLDPGRKWNRVSGLGPLTIVSRETLLDRFFSGGFLMYPIALLLLAMIVIAINSVWVYRSEKQNPARFVESARTAIAEGDLEGFDNLAREEKGLFASICRAMTLDFETSSIEDIKTRCESEAQRQVSLLRMPLKALNFIAAVAPLLGLLGTVIGMIICFDSLAGEAASAGKSQAMAAGIKVALITTAAGLCVAVPALAVYFVFNQKLNMLVGDSEGLATEFVHGLANIKREAPEESSAEGDSPRRANRARGGRTAGKPGSRKAAGQLASGSAGARPKAGTEDKA